MTDNYVIDNTRERVICSLVDTGQHVLISGQAGSGKTTLGIVVANRLGRPYTVVNCGSTQDARSALLGNYKLESGNTSFVISDFLKAIQIPNNVIVLDEFSRCSDGAFNILLPVLDFRQSIFVEELNQEFHIADGVRFIATANVGPEFSATRAIDRAVLDRFRQFHVKYISGKELESYIRAEVGGFPDGMDMIMKVYDFVNEQYNTGGLDVGLSPRTVLGCLSLFDAGFNVQEVFENVILSTFQLDSSMQDDVRRVREHGDTVGIFNTQQANVTF